MGFSISWIAVQGKSEPEVLVELGLVDSGEPDTACTAPIAGALLPDGWYLLYLNDEAHPFTSAAALQKLSRSCRVVATQVEEHVMSSSTSEHVNGRLIWKATHESERGERHLLEEGRLPPQYEHIKAHLLADQDRGDVDDEGVDYVWDIPLTLAHDLVGYRHDEVLLKSGDKPRFTRLEASR